MQNNIALDKALKFSIRIYNLSKILKEKYKEYSLSDQILRSGTSIGANLFESTTGESKKDFISKLSISLKEAKETEYWLLLLKEINLISQNEFDSIYNDCFELIKILTKSRSTARRKI